MQNPNTRGARGLCLEIHDLLVAKAIAGREKDVAFLAEAARHQMADPDILLKRLESVDLEPPIRRAARGVIHRAFGGKRINRRSGAA